MSHPLVLLGHQQAVSIITLNRPERSNSLVPELLSQLRSALVEVGERESTRAVVLTATGPAFSTGGDVQGFWDHRETLAAYASEIVGLLNDVMLTMLRLPQPIVTPVHGVVTGGSLGLILASDVVLVSPVASFRPWYGVVGFSPDGGWTALLPDVIGHQRARSILLTDQAVTAEEAVEWGMASELVPADQLLVTAMRIASVVGDQQPGTVRHAKQLVVGDLAGVGERLEAEREHFVHQVVTSEAREGMARFLGVG
ncbi:MAG: enoyl-CoA hydratase/isomerase family protein [Acidimicrobiia bacterium]|nr:enoyl-CoA hydratase/isomerase family protein [Acidimicrobiia bacterium]MBT8191828.1 enoyl-CoA hydratase/isomerase family protein [Acidimicrobiia bacterium]NNF89148.1 enoyl-CoA hydratase/isomerase family protein [Acidimicrobiia bacterium]NNL14931.1 enoyl-CoA hydratase/isomerase family protein [Acidimicrobiia bacterium]NNL97636.1 enoyl-CoA hydratase/isomerase family protein [Acidimicrobiia bacterium]